jgi:hypothetical protein
VEKKGSFNITSNPEEQENIISLTNTEEIKDFYEYTEECMKRIACLKVPTMEEISYLQIDLPFEKELETKKLAIFDLDETLVHCEVREPSKGQVQIKVKLPSGQKTKVNNFLTLLKGWFEY